MLTVGGTGNLNGDYWKKDAHKWAERVPAQAAWLAARRRDIGLEWFGATELHAEHSAHQPLMEELGQDWGVVPVPGGNLLIYVKDRLEVVSTAADHATARWFVKHNVRNPYHPETKYWLAIDHFISGSTPDIEAETVREARNGNNLLSTVYRGIRMGDFNSPLSDDPNSPRGVMRSAGWRSLHHTCPPDRLVDGDMNTGLTWGHDTYQIEDLLTRECPSVGHPLVDVVEARFWDARPLTDHSAFITATFDVHDKVLPAA